MRGGAVDGGSVWTGGAVGSTKLEVGSTDPLGSRVNVAKVGLAVGIGLALGDAVGCTKGGSVGVSDAPATGG